MERYRFIKKYDTYEGSIPQGSDITIMDNGALYFNGGLVHAAYQDILRNLVSNERLRNEYLVRENIIYNKI